MSSEELRGKLSERIAGVEARLAAACARAGRSRQGVTLVAVTKMISTEIAGMLPELGMVDLGESRPQELWHKASVLPTSVRWHLIGHLQRNKVARTLPLVSLIHSVGSSRLLQAIDEEAARQKRTVRVLLEINASHEANKDGFPPEEMQHLLPMIQRLANVEVVGLMTMAALEVDANKARPAFTLLRTVRDELRPKLEPPHILEHLSMGMTNDFEVAVEEGATFVRIGSALFQDLPGERT